MRKLDIAALIPRDRGGPELGARGGRGVRSGRHDLGMEFGETAPISRVVYGLVGLSGVWLAVRFATIIGHDRARSSARLAA